MHLTIKVIQDTYLSNSFEKLKAENSAVINELSERGIGANYSGKKFPAVHSDLATEYFNRETKNTAGPFRQYYSTNVSTTNKRVNTIHIHAKLRMAMRDKINVKTSSTNIELNDSAKQKHEGNVRSLKDCLKSYKIIPFSGGPVNVITSGVEAGATII